MHGPLPNDAGPVRYPAGTWWRVSTEHGTARNMCQDHETLGEGDWQKACHGTSMMALGKMRASQGASFFLEKGPSTTSGVEGVCVDGEQRRPCVSHCATRVTGDTCPGQLLLGVALELMVDRKRRARCPRGHVREQWCQDAGSVHVAVAWFHTTAMRETQAGIRKSAAPSTSVLGYYRIWNRAERKCPNAQKKPEAETCARRYSGES